MSSRTLVAGAIVLATLPLAVAGALQVSLSWAGGQVLFGLLWLVALWRGWRWIGAPALIWVVIASALEILWGSSPLPGLLAVLAALAAWDLEHQRWRLEHSGLVPDAASLMHTQRLRLLVVLVLGLLIGGLGLLQQFQLSFGWAALLGLLVLLGLSGALRVLRHEPR